MNIEELLAQSPQNLQESPFVQEMVKLIQNQAVQIQQQTVQIQQQTVQIQQQVEQISKLKEIIDVLKDEISRLNKTPKRPKFKPNKMEPRNRRKGNFQGNSSKNDKNICVPEKKLEEIKIRAEGVPQGARFKGYTDFKVQDLELVVKETTYKLEG